MAVNTSNSSYRGTSSSGNIDSGNGSGSAGSHSGNHSAKVGSTFLKSAAEPLLTPQQPKQQQHQHHRNSNQPQLWGAPPMTLNDSGLADISTIPERTVAISAVIDINEQTSSTPKHKMYFPLTDHQREYIGRIVKSMTTKVVLFIALLIDAIILIVETAADDDSLDHAAIDGITVTILSLLLFECFLRLAHLDIIGFLKDPWSIFDFLVSIISFISFLAVEEFGRWLVLMRLCRLSRVVWLVYRQHKGMKASARQLVSQNRRRFNKDGFDIDITYVTDRIIAMSVPAVAVEAMYRNPVREVARFFNTKHAAHYRIVNLCPERSYPYADFNGSVVESFMGDHNPAPIQQILDVCHQTETFLGEHKDNVIAFHCKGGKGRTGTMICSYLLYSGQLESPEDAMNFFANRRTSEKGEREGIEAKSQERFVRYIGAICAAKGALYRQLPRAHPLTIKSIRVHGVSLIHSDPLLMWFCMYQGMMNRLYDHKDEVNRESVVIHNKDMDYADFLFGQKAMIITNDIRIAFHIPKVKGGMASTIDKFRGKHTVTSPTSTSSSIATAAAVQPSSTSSASLASATSLTASNDFGVDSIGGNGGQKSKARLLHDIDETNLSSIIPVTIPHDNNNRNIGISESDGKVAVDFGLSSSASSPSSSSSSSSTLVSSASIASMRVGDVDEKQSPSGAPKKRSRSQQMKDKKAFGFWFHTSFIVARHLHLQRTEIDGVKKDKRGRFAKLAIDVYFD